MVDTATVTSTTAKGETYDFDSLMNKLMLMRAINRPSITDVMVGVVGDKWHGTKPNGTPWTITKIATDKCELSIAS